MRMPTYTSLDKKLERLFNDYSRNVTMLAEAEFFRVVKPYLDRHNLSIVTGGFGDWRIYRGNNLGVLRHNTLLDEDIPKRVLKVLRHEIPGMPTIDLGTCMPSYTSTPDHITKTESV